MSPSQEEPMADFAKPDKTDDELGASLIQAR
jgi:hypothetical protein